MGVKKPNLSMGFCEETMLSVTVRINHNSFLFILFRTPGVILVHEAQWLKDGSGLLSQK